MFIKVIYTCNSINNTRPDGSPYGNFNSKLIYDISVLNSKVKENNHKTLTSEINKQNTYAKTINKESFNFKSNFFFNIFQNI